MGLVSVAIALKALAVNKLRSLLTMLGIIIGVFTVVVLVSVGKGVENYVTEVFLTAGTNVVFVIPGSLSEQGAAGEVTLGDAQAIGDPFNVPYVEAIVAEVMTRSIALRGSESLEVEMLGIWPDHQVVRGWTVVEGDYITDQDIVNRARVAIIGQGTRAKLFASDEYPIGAFIRLDNKPFEVVGVMEELSAGVFGDFNESVFLPFTTMQDRFVRRKTVSGEYKADAIVVKTTHKDAMPIVQEEIEILLRDRHRISFNEDDDFSVISQADFMSIFNGVTSALTAFLGVVSAISLVVGGIGIMNIMLVSVTERTREIGLRKAIGARQRTILAQFVIEALALSVLGGLIGVILASLGVIGVNQSLDGLNVQVGLDAIFLGVGFCGVVGLVFGFYPALRASRLNPIQALRHE